MAVMKASQEQSLPSSSAPYKLLLILLVPSMASICTGFDLAVMNYINGMGSYLTYFNLEGQESGGGLGPTTGLIFGMLDPGTCSASLVAGRVSDRFGRRAGMFVGSLFCVVGGVVVTVARNDKYLKGGRFLLGVATALLQVSAPTYVNEISPPQWRGRLAIAMFGTIVSGVIANVTGQWSTSTSWRIPFAVQIIPAVIVTFGSYLIPESPRWLMSVGRKSEARRLLGQYHGHGDENAPLVVLEYQELEESIKRDASRKPWWDYASLFTTRSARYRTLTVLLMAFCAQFAGSGLSAFLVVLLASDHISAQKLRLLLTLVSNIVAAMGGLFGAGISDKVGRRSLWFWGNFCCTVALIISGACTAKWGTAAADYNPMGSNVAIAFLYLFTFCYCATYLPLPALYPSECMDFDNRQVNLVSLAFNVLTSLPSINGVALYTFAASAASLVNTYATPIALANIQWRLYIVFIAWDILACVLIWLFAVETGQRTLEELDEIFENRHPVEASRSYRKSM
ncbi:general substrate transporter [Roridomyces roridus]|uniref:General substrate transporter n=1 Tax=Roridomyces roridus TaxID=1738132 RepID=A0AAD7FUP9_9AGAR|nr:general substrate transporter [Roridomyces roridus]